MNRPLSDFEVISFDCYGTLIDWETGIWDALQPLFMVNGFGRATRRQALQAYARLESRVERAHPDLAYPEILRRVHAGLAEELGLSSTPSMDADFASSVGDWPAFADTAEALRQLGRRFRLVILSNVDRASFARSSRKLGVRFDAVYKAQDIGSYKPDLANFRYLKERVERDLGVRAEKILHAAQSLYHDHAPARASGLANAWIDRQRLSEGGDWGATSAIERRPEVDYRFFSLAELATAATAEG
jgi:2-haloalkanoic acid dehalogenase type II